MVLRKIRADEVPSLELNPVDKITLDQAEVILEDVKRFDLEGLLRQAVLLKDLKSSDDNLLLKYEELKIFYDRVSQKTKSLLLRTAERIEAFAQAQRNSVSSFETPVLGGVAGQILKAVSVAGCYAPGGRYPLPSSVLMTAITARVAGVQTIIVASPNPSDITLAAAYIAGATHFIKVGGAQAIGAMAYGIKGLNLPAAQCIVGPGNRWVTAAKKLVSGVNCCIDMLAGPSECLVLADSSAIPKVVAADLIAQGEHDVDALPILVTPSQQLLEDVNRELESQLAALPKPNRDVARTACSNGVAVLCKDLNEAINVASQLSPEHLEVMVEDSIESETCKQLENTSTVGGYGGLFIGTYSAEVFGDYGVGPNHVLPTSGTAKYTGGLSIFNFLRVRTYLKLDKGQTQAMNELVSDVAHFARLEGLEGHARAAEVRSRSTASKL